MILVVRRVCWAVEWGDLLSMGSHKRYLAPHEDFPGCALWTEDDLWAWDLVPWWHRCHVPSDTLPRLSRFLMQSEDRLLRIRTRLYPGEQPPPTALVTLKSLPDASVMLGAFVDHRVFVSFICWAPGGTRFGRERGRSWANRLAAGKCFRSLLHMLLRSVNMDVQFHLWWNGRWEPCIYRRGILDLSLLIQRHEMSEWMQFEHRWKQLVFSAGSGLSFLPSEPARCHLADLLAGAFLVSDAGRHATWMPTVYSLLAQVGNWMPALVARAATCDASAVPRPPHARVDKMLIHMWVSKLASSPHFSALPQVLRADEVRSVSDMCARIYREFTQRLLIRIRVEFADSKKVTIATDKSKAAPTCRKCP